MNNADMPAMPSGAIVRSRVNRNDPGSDFFIITETTAANSGLTKREQFCLQMGVPETGDSELDEIIRKGNRQNAAMAAMQGLCSRPGSYMFSDTAHDALRQSDAILAELAKVPT